MRPGISDSQIYGHRTAYFSKSALGRTNDTCTVFLKAGSCLTQDAGLHELIELLLQLIYI